ncbi:MAG: hypothetical protein ACXWJ8_05640 [Xanthobacteraceae bacterium]
MISSEQDPQSLVERLRELADRRQKAAAKERKLVAQGLLGAANGYRALADALERQPTLPWMQPHDLAARMGAARPARIAESGSATGSTAADAEARLSDVQ